MSQGTRGRFVTFEGIEGSGKSSQLGRLSAALETAGRRHLRTREPGGTPIADELRSMFLRASATPMAGEEELFLVLAARASHVTHVVLPAVERGEMVLCDRFSDSTLAYQGYGRGLPVEEVRRADRLAARGLRPDWTVLLDLPAEIAIRRARSRNERAAHGETRIDDEEIDFHARVRDGYLEIAREEPGRFTIVDAEGSVAEVAEAIAAEAARRGFL